MNIDYIFHFQSNCLHSGFGHLSEGWIPPVPSEMCDFHSQSQGMCWYFRTALETLSTQIETRRSGEIAVDHRTNDSSSVCGICEAYYISTRCESLYPKCNRISSNKSMNMTPYSPIPRRQRHFVDCQRTRMTQLTKDFAMRHDENYVEWNGISIKWYQFVTNCPYHQTIFQE